MFWGLCVWVHPHVGELLMRVTVGGACDQVLTVGELVAMG